MCQCSLCVKPHVSHCRCVGWMTPVKLCSQYTPSTQVLCGLKRLSVDCLVSHKSKKDLSFWLNSNSTAEQQFHHSGRQNPMSKWKEVYAPISCVHFLYILAYFRFDRFFFERQLNNMQWLRIFYANYIENTFCILLNLKSIKLCLIKSIEIEKGTVENIHEILMSWRLLATRNQFESSSRVPTCPVTWIQPSFSPHKTFNVIIVRLNGDFR